MEIGNVSSKQPDAYERLGASATKADIHAAVAGADPGLFPTAFCKLTADVLTGDPEWCAALHADGAGTKALVAYLVYRETGDPKAFAGIAQDALVMNIDDLACVGATSKYLAVNTIGRNSRYVPGEAIREIVRGFDWCANKWRPYGIEVVPTGGETADLGDAVRTIVVDAAVAARLRRSDVIDAGGIAPGDAIVGLSSTGQAVYEERPNSGVGSNGLTLARHALLHSDYRSKYPETVAPEIDPAITYRGKFRIGDPLPGGGMTVGEALLSPTRTYAPVLRRLIGEFGPAVHGLIHNTGGGLGKCLRFGKGVRFIKDNLFPMPPLFAAIAETGLTWTEMCRTFNLGQRMEVYVSPNLAERVIAIAAEFGIEARTIGRCERAAGPNEVWVKGAGGETTLTAE